MANEFPQDPDGDALRRLLADGNDLSKPMTIDFQVAVPNEASANGLASVAYRLGYRVKIYASPEYTLPWTCECSTRMPATHAAVVAIQEELLRLGRPYGGRPDGWGSFGNQPEDEGTAG